VKTVAAAVASGQFATRNNGQIQVKDVTLEIDDYEFRYVARQSGMGVAAAENFVVLLDLTSDTELVAEGRMRDLNRELQDLRKLAGLAYSDRVIVSIVGSSEIQKALDVHREWLMEQVLAECIQTDAIENALATADVDIGGLPVRIALKRTAV